MRRVSNKIPSAPVAIDVVYCDFVTVGGYSKCCVCVCGLYGRDMKRKIIIGISEPITDSYIEFYMILIQF